MNTYTKGDREGMREREKRGRREGRERGKRGSEKGEDCRTDFAKVIIRCQRPMENGGVLVLAGFSGVPA